MLALQAITPERLSSALAIPIAEARKLIAQVHRGEPVAATSAVRRESAAAVRAAGSVPALAVIEETAERDRSVREVPARGARRRAVRDRAHPARASRALHRVRQLAGRLRARVRVLRDRPARASRATSRRGRSSSRCAIVRARLAGAAASTASCSRAWASRWRTSTRARGDRGAHRAVRARHRRARDHRVHLGAARRDPRGSRARRRTCGSASRSARAIAGAPVAR